MLVADPSLVCAEEPALQQGDHAVDATHELMRPFRATLHHRHPVPVAQGRQMTVAFPAVGVDPAAGLHAGQDEGLKTVRRRIRDVHEADSTDPLAIFLCRNRNEGLALRLSARHALLHTTQVRFIDLNPASKPVTTRSDHRPAQLVKPRPRRHIAAQTQDALQPQSAGPVLLAGDIPDRPEPLLQRLASPLEDRPRRHRHLVVTLAALKPDSNRPGPFMIAARAGKSVRPAQLHQVLPTGVLGREPCFQLLQVPRIVLHAAGRYLPREPESTVYPFGGEVLVQHGQGDIG